MQRETAPGFFELPPTAVEDVGEPLQEAVAAALAADPDAAHLDDQEAGALGVLLQEADRRPARGPDAVVP